jgi:hypothetical protein
MVEELEAVVLADGFDDALIGYAYAPGRGYTAVYDAAKCLELIRANCASDEEAIEHFEYNVEGSWVGNGTPVFLRRH